MVHGIHEIRHYSKTKFKMKCIVCSKLTVEIAQHYQWLCRYVFGVHFEQTIPASLYLFKVNGRKLINNKDTRSTFGIFINNFE